MSQKSLTLHPVVNERISAAIEDLSKVTAGIDVLADTLSSESADLTLSGGARVVHVGLTLRLLYQQLMDVWDRLDAVNLTQRSARLYVRSPTETETAASVDSAA